MSGTDRIQEKVDETMHLLETEERMTADPYFFTRLKVRIDKKTTGDFRSFAPAGRWQPWILAVLAGLNIIIAAVWTFSSRSHQERNTAMTYLATDYHLTLDQGDWLLENTGE